MDKQDRKEFAKGSASEIQHLAHRLEENIMDESQVEFKETYQEILNMMKMCRQDMAHLK